MSWATTIRAAWNYLFDSEPRRRPRRARCACGDVWRLHSAHGCAAQDCPCLLNRLGKPATRPITVVKEKTG